MIQNLSTRFYEFRMYHELCISTRHYEYPLNEEARAAEHARAKEQWAKFMERGGFAADANKGKENG